MRRNRVSSIGLVSISPIRHDVRFFTSTFPGSAKSAEMSYVLDELHKHFKHKVIIAWDNLQAHKGLEQKYACEHPNWFHFERLPTYSPELNVVEQCWNQTKNVEMATQAINENKNLLPALLKHTKLKRSRSRCFG